jgi:hypothetical protein
VCFGIVLGRFSARESENTRKKIDCVSKKIAGEIIFRGGGIFFRVIFLTSFPFDFFVALVKRLPVRGTQRRDKKSTAGSCV